ncbi:MAG: hypothetical protein KU37_11735 [Sulfuricurvum sp. PC08-66]|nr:MAG: hypothetical protein KU37_11735 [Sulfuricurvum sp. PC08-66]
MLNAYEIIDKWNLQEKLGAMEYIWATLQNDTTIASPSWHQEILEKRLQEFENSSAIEWNEAKKQLKNLQY